ncbi:winged helix-turn-helix domain-containing protein [Mediterraneibacter gnavus]|uniref:winged helix-turn-helix domain-containing protein n=1 Tax=Mediterraneibacter gnavus TaxID=33038 RepID=UPI00321973DE
MQNVYPKEILIFERLEINYVERSVSINKEQVIFTSKEFEILFFLASYPGQVFTHRQIYETVWGKEYFCDEGNVTAHIGRIRKKIEPDPRNPTFIQTVRGVGYKFVKK